MTDYSSKEIADFVKLLRSLESGDPSKCPKWARDKFGIAADVIEQLKAEINGLIHG